MKRNILLGLGILLAIFIGYATFVLTSTKRHSPKDIAKYNLGDLSLSIEYCRPYKKGRLLFGPKSSDALEKYGEPWRTGANEATEIQINLPLSFPEGELPAGSYSLYSIPGENDWTIVFNSKLDYWGADITGSPFDPDLDVLRVTVPRQQTDSLVEQFTIDFEQIDNQVHMLLLWGNTKLEVPLTPKVQT